MERKSGCRNKNKPKGLGDACGTFGGTLVSTFFGFFGSGLRLNQGGPMNLNIVSLDFPHHHQT